MESLTGKGWFEGVMEGKWKAGEINVCIDGVKVLIPRGRCKKEGADLLNWWQVTRWGQTLQTGSSKETIWSLFFRLASSTDQPVHQLWPERRKSRSQHLGHIPRTADGRHTTTDRSSNELVKIWQREQEAAMDFSKPVLNSQAKTLKLHLRSKGGCDWTSQSITEVLAHCTPLELLTNDLLARNGRLGL